MGDGEKASLRLQAPGDFAAGAGGTVASSRAAISSLVSFPLGLTVPAASFCWSCSPLSQFPPVWFA